MGATQSLSHLLLSLSFKTLRFSFSTSYHADFKSTSRVNLRVCVCVSCFPHWQGEGRSAVSFLSPFPTPSVVLSPPSALNKCMWTSADSMSHLCQSAGFKAHRGHLRVPRGLVDWQQLNEKGMHMGAQH